MKYGSQWAPAHGETNGWGNSTFRIGENDCINQVDVQYGNYVDTNNFLMSVIFKTKLGFSSEQYGHPAQGIASPASVKMTDCCLCYISGSADYWVRQLKFHWDCPSKCCIILLDIN